MRLWMLVDPGFPELAAKADRLYASWELVTDRDWFERPYRWMVAQMAWRGLDTNGHAPFWAWHSWGGPGKRPHAYAHHATVPFLRLTLEVPERLALLSDFMNWHAVLCNYACTLTEDEYNAFEQLEVCQETQSRIEQTWPRIFDLHGSKDPEWNGKDEDRLIQACLPWFEHEWIRRIERFEPPVWNRPRRPPQSMREG